MTSTGPRPEDGQLSRRLPRRGLPDPRYRPGGKAAGRRGDRPGRADHRPPLLDLRRAAGRHQYRLRLMGRPRHRVLRRVRTVLETRDHGSFNSWGRDRWWAGPECGQRHDGQVAGTAFRRRRSPNIIRNSRWRCDNGWDIDLDDGSTNYQIYNNLCLAAASRTPMDIAASSRTTSPSTTRSSAQVVSEQRSGRVPPQHRLRALCLASSRRTCRAGGRWTTTCSTSQARRRPPAAALQEMSRP